MCLCVVYVDHLYVLFLCLGCVCACESMYAVCSVCTCVYKCVDYVCGGGWGVLCVCVCTCVCLKGACGQQDSNLPTLDAVPLGPCHIISTHSHGQLP